MAPPALLALEDGSVFLGDGFGAEGERRSVRRSSTQAWPVTRKS